MGGLGGKISGPGMPPCGAHHRPPRGAQTQGHTCTHTHIGKQTGGDTRGWRDTTGGYVDQRGRRRRDDRVLEQLAVTDTLRDNTAPTLTTATA